jgi:PAS domain S-box-containing protein
MTSLAKRQRSVTSRLLLFVVIFALTITGSHFLTRNAFDNLEKYQIILNKTGEFNDLTDQIVNHANQVINRVSADEVQKGKDRLSHNLVDYQVLIDLLKNGGTEIFENQPFNLPPVDAEVRPQLGQLERLWNQYKTKAEYIANANMDLLEKNNTNEEEGKYKKSIDESIIYINNHRDQLVNLQNQFNGAYLDISLRKKNQANAWLWGLWGVNLLLICLGYWFIQRLMIQPLSEISHVAEKIGVGDLSQKIAYQSANEVGVVATALNEMMDKIRHATDFIRSIEQGDLSISYQGLNGSGIDKDTLAGALLKMRDRMKNVAEEEQERNWSTRGLATFGDILQKFNDDTETLAYEVVSNVVRYFDANQGGLFVVNEEDEAQVSLELVACYAFNKRKFMQKKVAVGEGLVGQSYKDQDTIYLTDIPENYVDITSGLGGSQPRSVLVVPLKLSDKVYGVIELASFYEIAPYQIEFLKKLGENIAANLNTARANDQTRKLLIESTQITEQLQSKEAEMLQNLKILEATQTEMQKNQEALAAQSYAIKTTLLTVELSMDRMILSCNDLFMQATRYSVDELIGKDYRMLVPRTQVNDAFYEKLWRDLRNGIPRTAEVKRLDKAGREIWLRATYSPIKDKNGLPYKVLKLAFDITEDKRLRQEFKEQLDSFKRSNAIVEFSTDGKIIDANENFLDLMEYTRDEIIGEDHTIIVPEEDRRTTAYQALWHKLKQGNYHIGEVKRVTKSGKMVWFSGSFNPILDLNGKPYKIIEVIIDITDRKNAEARILATKEEIQAKEANLIALLNNTDDAIYTIGPNYRVTLLNESARKFFERMATSVRISSNVLEALPKNYYYIWKGFYDRALQGEKFSVEQPIFSEAINEKIYLSVNFNPIFGENNHQVTGVAIFSRDITSRKQRELDIADFTQKQNMRTARIIENQKQSLFTATEAYERETKDYKTLLERQKAEARQVQKEKDYFTHTDQVVMALNRDYELVFYNDIARQVYQKWGYVLQPHYHLPDTFPNHKHLAWTELINNAFGGETITFDQIFPQHRQHRAYAFMITLSPLKNHLQEVTQVIISATEISEVLYRARERKINTRKLKILQIIPQETNTKSIDTTPEQTRTNEQAKVTISQTALILAFNHERCVQSYNQSIKDTFAEWHLSLQPDYHLPDIFPAQRFEAWMTYCDRALAGEKLEVTEFFVQRKQARIRAFRLILEPQINGDNRVKQVVLTAYEIVGLVRKKEKSKRNML